MLSILELIEFVDSNIAVSCEGQYRFKFITLILYVCVSIDSNVYLAGYVYVCSAAHVQIV